MVSGSVCGAENQVHKFGECATDGANSDRQGRPIDTGLIRGGFWTESPPLLRDKQGEILRQSG